MSAATLIDPATKGFTTLADAAAKLEVSGVTKEKKIICYCGGGISATIDLFLLHQLGYEEPTRTVVEAAEIAYTSPARDA